MNEYLKTLGIIIISVVVVSISAGGQNYNYADTSFYSPILDETKSMRIYLPPGYDEDTISYPVVYYLHGATETYEALIDHMNNLQTIIENEEIQPLLVVGLDGQCDPFYGSLYTNSILYGNYEDYILQEAIPFAESVLRTKNSPHYRCIMGFAMGGYGSMSLAIKHPDMFAGLASYNGILQFDTTFALWHDEVLFENIGPPYHYQFEAGIFTSLSFTGSGAFSPNLSISPYQIEFIYDTLGLPVDSVMKKWKAYDCSRLVKDLDISSGNYPGIFFGCGLNDFLYFHPTNTCFADTLDQLGINYKFHSNNDGHVLSYEMLLAGMQFLDSLMYDSIWTIVYENDLERSDMLHLFPNPASNMLNIAIEDHSIDMVRIYSLTGRKLLKTKAINSKIDISRLPPGMYIVEIIVENTRLIQKLLVQR